MKNEPDSATNKDAPRINNVIDCFIHLNEQDIASSVGPDDIRHCYIMPIAQAIRLGIPALVTADNIRNAGK